MSNLLTSIPKIVYEGPRTRNPWAFKWYNPTTIVEGRPMSEHLPFAYALWHGAAANLADIFGEGTAQRPWEVGGCGVEAAKVRLAHVFEIMSKLGVSNLCFHDLDLVGYGDSLREFHARIDQLVPTLKELMAQHNISIGWATQNLFSHPIYAKGAATSPNPLVFAHAVAQTRKMIELGKELGAKGHVYWGGREGYDNLLNTRLGFELDRLGQFLGMMFDYARSIGAEAQGLIEPKPMEPTKEQYDHDSATCIGFLLRYGLAEFFKLNIEVNHAQLAGHEFPHEVAVAGNAGMLGGIDVNQGTFGNGWDTDEFLSDPRIAALTMYQVLQAGGLGKGVFNFDAKPRRNSHSLEDLIRAHIEGMDTLALGLRTAAWLRADGRLAAAVNARYSGYDGQLGQRILDGEESVHSLTVLAYENTPTNSSDGVEGLEGIVTQAMALAGAQDD